MNTLLDNLFARRPKLHYVCPPLCGCQFVVSSSGQPSVSFETVSPLECVNYRVENGVLAWNDYPGAVCYTVYQAPAPDAPPPVGLPCVNYYLTSVTNLSASFTWDPYPDASSYNVYRNLGNNAGYTRTQSEIPVSVLPIDCESIVVTANTSIGETLACVPVSYCSPCRDEVSGWLLRVAATGSPTPPLSEQLAVCDFVAAMKAAGLWDKMYSVNHWSPTSVEAALTWLKKGLMPDAANLNWRTKLGVPTTSAGCSVTLDGFNNASKNAGTGIPCSAVYDLLDCGITSYVSKPSGAYGEVVGTVISSFETVGPDLNYFSLQPWLPYTNDFSFGTTTGGCWYYNFPVLTTANPSQLTNHGCGYVSMNRMGINDVDIYYAFSGGHTKISLPTTSHPGAVPTTEITLFDATAQISTFDGRLSFTALHTALTEAESATLASLILTFRVALGGGYL